VELVVDGCHFICKIVYKSSAVREEVGVGQGEQRREENVVNSFQVYKMFDTLHYYYYYYYYYYLAS